jgi:hypothetical protein
VIVWYLHTFIRPMIVILFWKQNMTYT